MGRASAIWSKLWPAPEVMVIDSASTRAITDATISVQMNRTSGDCCFALRIASDSTEGILPPPAAGEKKRAGKVQTFAGGQKNKCTKRITPDKLPCSESGCPEQNRMPRRRTPGGRVLSPCPTRHRVVIAFRIVERPSSAN